MATRNMKDEFTARPPLWGLARTKRPTKRRVRGLLGAAVLATMACGGYPPGTYSPCESFRLAVGRYVGAARAFWRDQDVTTGASRSTTQLAAQQANIRSKFYGCPRCDPWEEAEAAWTLSVALDLDSARTAADSMYMRESFWSYQVVADSAAYRAAAYCWPPNPRAPEAAR